MYPRPESGEQHCEEHPRPVPRLQPGHRIIHGQMSGGVRGEHSWIMKEERPRKKPPAENGFTPQNGVVEMHADMIEMEVEDALYLDGEHHGASRSDGERFGSDTYGGLRRHGAHGDTDDEYAEQQPRDPLPTFHTSIPSFMRPMNCPAGAGGLCRGYLEREEHHHAPSRVSPLQLGLEIKA